MTALLLLALLSQNAADAAYDEARAALEANDARGAEAAARKALALSLAFVPEQEIEARPDKGILFDEMILEARGKYRIRRERYFRMLGDVLTAEGRWRAARKAFTRAAGIAPSPELYLLMADDEDLGVSERLEFLLDAYLSPGADRQALEARLLETGAFRTRNALKASLDEHRFRALQSEFPDLELISGAFPSLQVVTDGGTLNTAALYNDGTRLIVYIPVDVCAHCSEQLDGITVPVLEARRREMALVVAAFVPEPDLPIARRIVRLLGMPVSVGRRDGLPSSLRFLDSGEIRVVARGGLTQIRITMSPDVRAPEIRKRVEAIFSFLDAPGLPTEEEPEKNKKANLPLVTLKKRVNEHREFFEWIDTLEKLEAGPAPLDDFYEQLRRLGQRLARGTESRELGFEIMAGLGRLGGAKSAKTRTLALLGADIGDRLLAEVQKVDPKVRRTAPPRQGIFFADVTEDAPRRVVMQRSFQTRDGLRHFDIVLDDDGQDVAPVWLAPSGNDNDDEPKGVDALAAGAAFLYRGDDCEGLRLVRGGELVYESCDATVLDGDVIEVRPALVDPVEDGPAYFRRNVVSEPPETALDRGLRLFDRGDFSEAAAAFEQAMSEIDPEAPYDASDLVYDRARALEALGKRQEALALYRSIGDVSYQELVDEAAGRIEGAPR